MDETVSAIKVVLFYRRARLPTRESAEARKQERKTRRAVPGEVCCSEGGQVGIPGLSPLPHQHSDRGGEE